MNFTPARERNGITTCTGVSPVATWSFISFTRASLGSFASAAGISDARYTLGGCATYICFAIACATVASRSVMQSSVCALGCPVFGNEYLPLGGNFGVDWMSQNAVLLERSKATTPLVWPRELLTSPVIGFSSL